MGRERAGLHLGLRQRGDARTQGGKHGAGASPATRTRPIAQARTP
jgi:hypothetical protein